MQLHILILYGHFLAERAGPTLGSVYGALANLEELLPGAGVGMDCLGGQGMVWERSGKTKLGKPS